jgi:hypothetical protein
VDGFLGDLSRFITPCLAGGTARWTVHVLVHQPQRHAGVAHRAVHKGRSIGRPVVVSLMEMTNDAR